MIWAYMGPAERMPELPALEVALVPAAHRYVSKKWQDCNWVQALEGSIDTAHFSFAHLTFDKDEDEDLDIAKHLVSPHVAHELRPRALDRRRPAPGDQGQPARCRADHRRRPHRRRRQHLLAHRPVPDARPRLRAERHAGREHVRPVVRAGHRHQLLDLHLRLEPGAAAHAGRARDATSAATA